MQSTYCSSLHSITSQLYHLLLTTSPPHHINISTPQHLIILLTPADKEIQALVAELKASGGSEKAIHLLKKGGARVLSDIF